MDYYDYQLPNGSTIKVPVGVDEGTADELARQQFPDAYAKQQAAPSQGGFFSNLISSGKDLGNSTAYGIQALLGDPAKAVEAAKAAQAANQVPAVSFGDVKKAYETAGLSGAIPAFGAYARDFAAQNAPMLAASLAGAEAGGAAGSALGPIGTAVGAGLGGLAPLVPSFAMSNLQRQQQANPVAPLDVGKAYAGATGEAALQELIARIPGVGALGALGERAMPRAVEDVAAQSLPAAIARGAVSGTATAVPAMVGQTAIERWQAGQPLTGDEANQEYLGAAGSGAMFGGMLGPYHGITARSGAQAKVQADADAQLAQRGEEQAAADAAAQAAYKASPQYLLDLDAQHQANQEKTADLQAQISALGKPVPGSAEAAQKADLVQQMRDHIPQARATAQEWNANQMAISKLKQDPLDYQLENTPNAPAPIAPANPVMPGSAEDIAQKQTEQQAADLIPGYADATPAGAMLSAPEPADTAKLQSQLDAVHAGIRNAAEVDAAYTPTGADYASKLLETPGLATAAKQSGVGFSALDPAVSKGIINDAAKTEAANAKKAAADKLAQENAARQQQATDLQAQQTTPTIDPLTGLKEGLEQDQAQREAPANLTDQLTSWGLHGPDDTIQPGYLDNLFERAVNPDADPNAVPIPDAVKADAKAPGAVDKADTALGKADAANTRVDNAVQQGNLAAAKEAVAERAQATSLPDAHPVTQEIIDARKAQEAALVNAGSLLHDLQTGNVLGGPKSSTASSTRQTLINQINRFKQEYISNIIREAAVRRAANGKMLPKMDALRAGQEIGRVFNEWTTRANALPRHAVLEERTTPAQMRGTEIVKSAETTRVDPRPLEERRFGAYKEATEVLKQEIAKIKDGLLKEPNTATRDEQLLRTQFAGSEAAKVAHGRGETAATRGGELTRLREHVGNKVDKALASPTITPSARMALDKAKTVLERDEGTQDVHAPIEQGGSKTGLIDAAERLADHVNEGRAASDDATRERVDEVKEALKDHEVPEGQTSLFDPHQLDGQKQDVKDQIAAHEQAIAEHKAALDKLPTKFTSMKEGIAASKERADRQQDIDNRTRSIAELKGQQSDLTKQAGALQRAQAKEQAGLGHIRATAANFDKSPEVVKGRAAVAQIKAINEHWKARDAEVKKKTEALKQQLAEINARLSTYDWVKEIRGETKKHIRQPVDLGLEREIELQRLKIDQREAAKPLAKETRIGKPLTELEAAQHSVARQVANVRSEYQEATYRALEHLKDTALTDALRKRMDAAYKVLTEAQHWIDAHETDWRQHQELTAGSLKGAQEGGFAKHAEVLIKQRKAVNEGMRAHIDAEHERLNAAEKELAAVRQEMIDSITGKDVVAKAATDHDYNFEKLNLEYLKNELEKKGFVVDLDKGTVRTKDDKPAPAEQASVRKQQAEIASAEAKQKQVADESARQAAQRTGLDLPGVRRIRGKIEPIESATERAERERIEGQDNAANLKEHVETRRLGLDIDAQEARAEVERLHSEADELRKQLAGADAAGKTKLMKELKKKMAEIGIAQTREDMIGEQKPRFKGPTTRKQSSEPLTMRTGTPESREVTNNIRASERSPEKVLTEQDKANQRLKEMREANRQAANLEKGNAKDTARKLDNPVVRPDDLFRTGDKAEGGLAAEHSTRVVNDFLKDAPAALKNRIEFYPEAKDIPAKRMQELNKIGAIDDEGRIVKGGVLADGKILVVGDAHTNIADLQQTLAHEITGHYGVRKLLGDEGINKLTENLAKNDGIGEMARSMGLDDALAEARATSEDLGESKPQADRRAVEELLGHLEQRTPTESVLEKAGRWVREIVGAVNAALTKMGLRSPYKVTPADLAHILRQARGEAMREGDITNGESVWRRATATHEDDSVGRAARTMIGTDKSLGQRIKEFGVGGFGGRNYLVDRMAALEGAAKKGKAENALQLSYDLMNFRNKNHFLSQAILHGAPDRTWWEKRNGTDLYKTEVHDGPSLSSVAKLLGDIKGVGNHQAISDKFSLLAAGKRAQTEGWDVVFGDSKHDTPQQLADKAHARSIADALAKELDEGKSPFAPAYREYQDMHKGMLQFLMHAGNISEKEFRALAGKQNYTPLFRHDQHGNVTIRLDQNRTITAGKMGDDPQLRMLLGDGSKIMDWFDASARNHSVIIDQALNNLASRQAVMTLNAIDSGLTKAAVPLGKNQKTPADVAKNVIEYRHKGDLQRMLVDTDALGIPTHLVMQGFNGVPASLPAFVRMMGKPANLLRKTATRNPFFLFRSVVRDPLEAWLGTGANFNPITDTLKEMGKALTGKGGDVLERRGVTGGLVFAHNGSDLDRIKKEAMTDPTMAGMLMAKADSMAQIADGIERKNVYNAAIRDGASEMQATLAAWKSMPYSISGTSTSIRYLNHMIPFLNSAIQGWDVLYRAATNQTPLADRVNVRNKLLLRGGIIAGMTMAYSAAMQNDEDYQKASASDRLNNWMVNVPGVGKVKLPVPFELGLFFKMIPEAMMRVATQGKDANQEVRDVLTQAASMVPTNIIPQGAIPIVDALSNTTNIFGGSPIESQAQEGIDINKRIGKNTTELSKLFGFQFDAFGKQYGISPAKMEFMASEYTAGLYPMMAAFVDNILPAPAIAKPTRTLAQLPMFRSVLLDTDNTGMAGRLYDRVEELAKTNETVKYMMSHNPVELGAYVQEHKGAMAAGAKGEAYKKVLDNFAQVENKIRYAPGLTGDQKQEKIRIIHRARDAAISRFAPDL